MKGCAFGQENVCVLGVALVLAGSACVAADIGGEGVSRSHGFEEEAIDIESPSDVLPNQVHSQEIYREDAAAMRLHFSYLDLAPGDVLEIMDATGETVQVLRTSESAGWTLDVLSDAVGITLVTGDGKHDRGYKIDRLAVQRYDDGGTGEIASICGNDEKKPAACFSQHTAIAASAKATGVLRYSKVVDGEMRRFVCSGALVSREGHFLTNNHCIGSADGTSGAQVAFNFQRETCEDSTNAVSVTFDDVQFVRTNQSLDYTLLKLPKEAADEFGFLQIDGSTSVRSGREIYIPQHPGGRLKEIAVHDGANPCRVSRTFSSAFGSGTEFFYQCDTEKGSSGSPVMDAQSHRLIGLHHQGGCNNQAVRMSRILPEINPEISAPSTTPFETVETAIAGDLGSSSRYSFSLPAETVSVTISIEGGSGDADLYVARDREPTRTDWDGRPFLSGNNESVYLNPLGGSSTMAGTIHILLHAYRSYSGVSLRVRGAHR